MSQNFDEVTAGSPVAQFYENRVIFITGSTGFMGKVLVEKLLRSTSVKKIYLLIRQKKGVATQARLQDLLSSKLFDSVRTTRAGELSKLVAVHGDITQPRLGLSTQDEKLLVENVSVVFHSAATVKFDEDLTKSVAMNVESVQSMISLCKKMKKLEALVHVSTAYCNCDRSEIKEEVYPPPGNPQGFIQLCKCMDEETLNSPEMTAKLIGNRPNTYTFTKSLAENLLITEGAGLPISIVRPSIVSAAWREPFPGWVDNLNGPTGLIAGCGTGILRTLHCGRDLLADLVPVDIPINLMCCVAWRTATQPSSCTQVYNCTSSSVNPITWGGFEAYTFEFVRKYPSKQLFWYPGGSLKTNETVHQICQILFEACPAYLADLLAWLTGRRPSMVRINQRMNKATKALEYFTTNEWKWNCNKTSNLYTQLTEGDRTLFNFDLKELNWSEYIETYVKGVREYVFKEDWSTLPGSRTKLMQMYWLDKTLLIMMFLGFWKFIFYSSESSTKLWESIISLIINFFSFPDRV